MPRRPTRKPKTHPVKKGRPEGTRAIDAQATERGANYTAAEGEFLKAVERFQKQSKRKFLSHVDYLRVLLALGYTRSEPK